jgi:hypothetical protein
MEGGYCKSESNRQRLKKEGVFEGKGHSSSSSGFGGISISRTVISSISSNPQVGGPSNSSGSAGSRSTIRGFGKWSALLTASELWFEECIPGSGTRALNRRLDAMTLICVVSLGLWEGELRGMRETGAKGGVSWSRTRTRRDGAIVLCSL